MPPPGEKHILAIKKAHKRDYDLLRKNYGAEEWMDVWVSAHYEVQPEEFTYKSDASFEEIQRMKEYHGVGNFIPLVCGIHVDSDTELKGTGRLRHYLNNTMDVVKDLGLVGYIDSLDLMGPEGNQYLGGKGHVVKSLLSQRYGPVSTGDHGHYVYEVSMTSTTIKGMLCPIDVTIVTKHEHPVRIDCIMCPVSMDFDLARECMFASRTKHQFFK